MVDQAKIEKCGDRHFGRVCNRTIPARASNKAHKILADRGKPKPDKYSIEGANIFFGEKISHMYHTFPKSVLTSAFERTRYKRVTLADFQFSENQSVFKISLLFDQ